MMLNTTIDGLKALRLDAMAAALAEQHQQAAYTGLGFDERLGLLVDRELTGCAPPPPSRTSTSATPAAWTVPRSSPWPRRSGPSTTTPS
jgi:hypothetical protein